MKRKIRPEVLMYLNRFLAMIVGFLIWSFLTWVVMSALDANAKIEEPEILSKPLPTETKITADTENKEPEMTRDEIGSDPRGFKDEPEIVSSDLQAYPVGVCEITAYCNCVACCGIWSDEHPSRVGTGYVQKTASGTIPTQGRTVAVDPEVIPLGAAVWINGVSYIAEDTGNAVSGNVVDIFFESHEEASRFGRQTAEVYYVY